MRSLMIVPRPRRILVAGDTHSNASWWSRLVELAVRCRCEGIVELGDLEYSEREVPAGRFVELADRDLEAAGLWCVWVDGNHDDHPALRRHVPRSDGFVAVRPHMLHAPRGHRWMWCGVRFLALGGAASFKRDDREENISWFTGEDLSDEQVASAVSGGPADIVLCHDAPAGIPAANRTGDEPTRRNRQRIRTVVDAVRPQLVLHGHLHHYHETALPADDGHQTYVVGLDAHGAPNSAAILDLTALGTALTLEITAP